MFLSIFKERSLHERLERFFTRLESGKLKADAHEQNVWTWDTIELKIEETTEEIRCYFHVDYRTIYIFHYVKEVGQSKMIVEREDYLHEHGCQGDLCKGYLLAYIRRNLVKNPC